MDNQNKRTRIIRQSSPVYWMGLIGAMIYFLQHASGFWMGILGVLKALVWPGVLVYWLLGYLKL